MNEKVIIRCVKTCPCGDEHKRLFRGETAIVLGENATREGEVDFEVITGRVAGKFQTCPKGCLQPVQAVSTTMEKPAPEPVPPIQEVAYSDKGYGITCDQCGAGINESHATGCLAAQGLPEE